MATPTPVAYNIAHGATCYGGKTRPLPAYVPAPGQLKSIHLNSLSSIDPCPGGQCWFSGDSHINGPWINWCGAVFASDFSQYGAMVYWGAGHTGGNDTGFSVFDLTTQRWLRLGGVPAADTATGITDYPSYYDQLDLTWCDYVDPEHPGRGPTPPTTHTYGSAAYVPAKFGGGAKGTFALPYLNWGPYDNNTKNIHNGGGYKPHGFDLTSEVWTRFTESPYAAVDLANTPAGPSFVDTKRGVLWAMPFCNGKDHVKIDLKAVTKTIVSIDANYIWGPGYNAVMRYVESEDIAVAMYSDGSTNGTAKTILFDMASGMPAASVTINLSNAAPSVGGGFGFDWCPDTKKFYAVQDTKTNTLLVLTPPPSGQWKTGTWTWSTEVMGGETLVNSSTYAPNAQGPFVLTHWTYNPALKSFMWTQGAVSTTSPDGVSRNGAFQLYRPLGT